MTLQIKRFVTDSAGNKKDIDEYRQMLLDPKKRLAWLRALVKAMRQFLLLEEENNKLTRVKKRIKEL